LFGFSPAGQRANWLASPARSVDPLRPEDNPKLCSAAGVPISPPRSPARSSSLAEGQNRGFARCLGRHSETLFGIGQPGGCPRGASCLAAARCQDLPETLFASGAWRHQEQLAAPAGGQTASLKKPNIY